MTDYPLYPETGSHHDADTTPCPECGGTKVGNIESHRPDCSRSLIRIVTRATATPTARTVEEAKDAARARISFSNDGTTTFLPNEAALDALIAAVKRSTLAEVRRAVQGLYSDSHGEASHALAGVLDVLAAIDAMQNTQLASASDEYCRHCGCAACWAKRAARKEKDT